MFKLRLSALAAVGLLAFFGGGTALAAKGGDRNAGDVWLDNVGQPPGPGHEMDPHLACQDINLWGDRLADGSGTFTIDGWPPSGSKQTAYSGTWSYDGSQGGDQVVAKISVSALIRNAQANGDSAAHKGFHFKLNFAQDPHKHKTFWVACTTAPPPTNGTRQTSRRHRTAHHRTATHHRRRHRHRRFTTRRTARHRISRRPRAARGFTG